MVGSPMRRPGCPGRVGETACPGAALKHQIKEIRHRAQALFDLPPGAPSAP